MKTLFQLFTQQLFDAVLAHDGLRVTLTKASPFPNSSFQFEFPGAVVTASRFIFVPTQFFFEGKPQVDSFGISFLEFNEDGTIADFGFLTPSHPRFPEYVLRFPVLDAFFPPQSRRFAKSA